MDSNGYRICKCQTCSHLFVPDSIAPQVLEQAYDESFYVSGTEEAAPKGYKDYLSTLDKRLGGFRRWFQGLESIVGRPGRSLDFGCAVGVMVKAAQDCGWDAVGYERSQWAAAYGRERFGIEITTGDGASDPFEPESFDLVTMWDVVEHLEAPREIIGLVHRWLRPGGWIAINTVNSGGLGAHLAGSQWRHLRPPVHLQYFTRRSLSHLLTNQGFDIKCMRGNGVFLSAKRSTLPLGGLTRAVEECVTHWRSRAIADALDLLDEVEVLASKP